MTEYLKCAGGWKDIQLGELADKMYCELYSKLPDMDEKQNKEREKQRIIKIAGKNAIKLAEGYAVNFDRNKINRLIGNTIADDLLTSGEIESEYVIPANY